MVWSILNRKHRACGGVSTAPNPVHHRIPSLSLQDNTAELGVGDARSRAWEAPRPRMWVLEPWLLLHHR